MTKHFSAPALSLCRCLWNLTYFWSQKWSLTLHLPPLGLIPDKSWGTWAMEGQTSAQPWGTNHPFHKQGFCPTNEDYSACTAGLELLEHFLHMSCWGRKGHALEILWLREAIWEFLTALQDKEINLPGTRNTYTTITNAAFLLSPRAAAIPISGCIWREASVGPALMWTHCDVQSEPNQSQFPA